MEKHWQINLGEYAIDWSASGNEWLERFNQHVVGSIPGASGSATLMDVTTGPFIRVTLCVDGRMLPWSLWLRRTDSAVHIHAGGDRPEPDEQMLQMLREVLDRVSDDMGGQSVHAWHAVIGAPPDRVSGQEPQLSSAFSVGGLHVESSEILMKEPAVQRASLSSLSTMRSIPMIVSGSSSGVTWVAASRAGARELRHVCNLLAVVWDYPIVVRGELRHAELGRPIVPVRVGNFEEPPGLPDIKENFRRVAAPDELDANWTVLEDSAAVSRALDMYAEGIAIQAAHSSLAAVAFTASIETLIASLESLPRCGTCNVVTGSTKRFKRGLRLVLSDEEASELDRVYDRRSRTVHDGLLHGDEVSPGARVSFWSEDSGRDFRFATLEPLRRAARQMLLRALAGRLADEWSELI